MGEESVRAFYRGARRDVNYGVEKFYVSSQVSSFYLLYRKPASRGVSAA